LLDTIATCLQNSQLEKLSALEDAEVDEAWVEPESNLPEPKISDTVAVLPVAPVNVFGDTDAGENGSDELASDDGEVLDILVAEDNETNQNYIEYILDDVDVAYTIVPDGAAAVETWQARKPRIILMDISMPGMNGHEATQKIRELEAETGSARTPIVALTAHTLKGDKEKCLEVGMDDYMSKPVSVQNVKDMLAKWEIASEEESKTG